MANRFFGKNVCVNKLTFVLERNLARLPLPKESDRLLNHTKPLLKNRFSTHFQGTGQWEGPIHFSRFVLKVHNCSKLFQSWSWSQEKKGMPFPKTIAKFKVQAFPKRIRSLINPLLKTYFPQISKALGHERVQFTVVGLFSGLTIAAIFSRVDPGARRRKKRPFSKATFSFSVFVSVSISLSLFLFLSFPFSFSFSFSFSYYTFSQKLKVEKVTQSRCWTPFTTSTTYTTSTTSAFKKVQSLLKCAIFFSGEAADIRRLIRTQHYMARVRVCVRVRHQYRINMACTTLLRNTSWPQIPATLSPERWSRGWTMQFQDCWWTRSWSANLPSLPHWWRPQTAEKRFAVDATQLPQLRGSPTFDWKMLRPRMGSHQQHLQLPVPSGQVWPELKPIAMHMRWPLGTAHDRWTHDLLALLRSQQRCREQLGPQNSKCHSLQRPNRRKWWEHRLCLSIHLCTQLQLTSSSPFCQMGNEDHTGKCSSQVCSCKLCNCSTAWNLILRKFLMATWKRRLLRHSTTWAVKSVRKKRWSWTIKKT